MGSRKIYPALPPAAADFERLYGRKRSKYGNKTVVDPVDGIFHSQAEYKRWKELQLLERAGEITGLLRQERFNLIVNGLPICTYVCDFYYVETGKRPLSVAGTVTVEDVKGVHTPEFKIKRKLMKACHGIDISIIGKSK